MAQFKIYGNEAFLRSRTEDVSDALHEAAMVGLGLPPEKRFHRFIVFENGFMRTPDDRSDRYLIIECVLFEGRTVGTKRAFYAALLEKMAGIGVTAQDLEFVFIETPRHDWLIRGVPADELELNYDVDI